MSVVRSAQADIEQDRRASLLALPLWTLIRVGWRTGSDHVQGQIYYRVGGGLGPTGRDADSVDQLRRAVSGIYRPEQPWGFEVLASPPAPVASPEPVPTSDFDEPHKTAGA